MYQRSNCIPTVFVTHGKHGLRDRSSLFYVAKINIHGLQPWPWPWPWPWQWPWPWPWPWLQRLLQHTFGVLLNGTCSSRRWHVHLLAKLYGVTGTCLSKVLVYMLWTALLCADVVWASVAWQHCWAELVLLSYHTKETLQCMLFRMCVCSASQGLTEPNQCSCQPLPCVCVCV
jgi:hypothetical protein